MKKVTVKTREIIMKIVKETTKSELKQQHT